MTQYPDIKENKEQDTNRGTWYLFLLIYMLHKILTRIRKTNNKHQHEYIMHTLIVDTLNVF